MMMPNLDRRSTPIDRSVVLDPAAGPVEACAASCLARGDSPGAFRDMMALVPGAVTIIASEHAGVRKGITATAVCSVSAEPPQLLICVNGKASVRSTISQSGVFSVNFLARHHEVLARKFSEAGLDHDARFAFGDWMGGSLGAPVLADALSSAVCEVVSESKQATHVLFIGRIAELRLNAARPLLYHQRAYCDVAPREGVA